MGSVSIKTCDTCGGMDSDENPIRRVTIVGPRVDACAGCRLNILVSLGAHQEDAERVVEEQNTGEMKPGRQPGIRWSVPAPEEEPDEEETEDEGEPAENGSKAKRRTKVVAE